MRSLFPSEFENLPRDCVERMWDRWLDEASGVYVTRAQFDAIFGEADSEVRLFESAGEGQDSDALQKLFVLFELPARAG